MADSSERNSIGRKALIYILLASSVFSLILTGLQLFIDYKSNLKAISENITGVRLSSQDAITHSLWLLEENILQTQLNGLAGLPYIDRVEIIETGDNVIYSAGELKGKFTTEHLFPLYYLSKDIQKKRILGKLIITSNHDSVYQDLLNQVGIIFSVQIIKTFCVSIIILLILHHLILKHIYRLAHHIKQFDTKKMPVSMNKPIRLLREKGKDEIDLLEDEINDLQERLIWHLEKLERKERDLQCEIQFRRDAESIIKAQYDFSNGVLESLRDSIITIDDEKTVLHANNIAKKYFHIVHDEKVCNFLKISLIKSDNDVVHSIDIKDVLDEKGDSHMSGYCITADNHKIPVSINIHNTIFPDGGRGKVLVIVDESETEKFDEVNYNATHDLMTGVVNRYQFNEILKETLKERHKDGEYSLAFIDIDNFKSINDVFGHTTGDYVIKSIARCIGDLVKNKGVVGRFGGDEFTILLHCGIDDANTCMEELLEVISNIGIGEKIGNLYLSGSIGITPLYHNDDTQQALIRADRAAYDVKKNGGAGVSMAYQNHGQLGNVAYSMQQHYQLLTDVKQAILDNQLSLYHQEITPLSNATNLPFRSEVLVRFTYESQITGPQDILSITDQYKVTSKVDLWVLNTLASYIINDQVSQKYLNVNLSPQSIHSPAIFDAVMNLLDICRETNHQICFELTENTLVKSLDIAREFMLKVRKKGGYFALDDFGTGYASFGMLKSLSIDMLKLDGSLFNELDEKPHNREIILSIKRMATAMNMQTVAEHIPTQDILNWLDSAGIHYSQSYLHSEPSPLLVAATELPEVSPAPN